MSFIFQREHQVSVPFALAEGPACRVQKDRFSVCDILPCHSLYNDISKQRCLRDDKNRSHGSSHTANVCGRSLACVPGWHLWTYGKAFLSPSEVYVPDGRGPTQLVH